MRKVLVAVENSDCSFRAVRYCTALFSGLTDVSFTLFHVLPYMPPEMWDPGHIPNEQERAAQQAVIDKWFDHQNRRADPVFQKSGEILLEAGFDPTKVVTKTVSDSTDVAGSILEEARNGGYFILVMGRCGSSGIKGFFLGSTTTRVINRGAGLAICLVE